MQLVRGLGATCFQYFCDTRDHYVTSKENCEFSNTRIPITNKHRDGDARSDPPGTPKGASREQPVPARRPPTEGAAASVRRRPPMSGAGLMAAPLRLGRAARLLPAAAARVAASEPLPRLSSSSSRHSAPLPAMQAFQYPEVYRDEAAVSTAGVGVAHRAPEAPLTRNSDSGAPRRPERLCRGEPPALPFEALFLLAPGVAGRGDGPCGAARGGSRRSAAASARPGAAAALRSRVWGSGDFPARLGNAGLPGCLRGTAGFSVMVHQEHNVSVFQRGTRVGRRVSLSGIVPASQFFHKLLRFVHQARNYLQKELCF